MVVYTLSLLGNGQTLTVTDDLPLQVGAPGPMSASMSPPPTYDAGTHRVTWSGSPSAGEPVTITIPVDVVVGGPMAVYNTALLSDTQGHVSQVTRLMIVDPIQVRLPVVFKGN
jgi:hypothetical protein